MKTYKILCMLLSALLLFCACGETSETSQNSEVSSVPEESVTENEPVRYTYADEATVYDMSGIYRVTFNDFHYVGGNTVVCIPSQNGRGPETPLMAMYDLVTGEYKQTYVPKDDYEKLCTYFLGVRENGEFGMTSAFGESVWFDKDGKFLEQDTWFDGDDISPAYHELIGTWDDFFDNGENLICYYDSEKSIPDREKEYYMLFDRTTGEKTEFLVWNDAEGDEYENYTVLGFAGKNRILYQKEACTYQDGSYYSYTLHLRDLTTGKETVAEAGDSPVSVLYLRETEGGCQFVVNDRRWLKTMFLSEDGTLSQVGESYTAVGTSGELWKLYFDSATKTIAVLTDEELGSGELKIALLDAETLTEYTTVEISLGQDFVPTDLRICHDGTVQAFARNGDSGMLVLWRTE